MANTKSIAKSVRLTQEVFDYIMEVPGKGFNEKIERLVMETKQSNPELPKQLIDTENMIERRQLYLNKLVEKSDVMDLIVKDLIHLQHNVHRLQDYAKDFTDDS